MERQLRFAKCGLGALLLLAVGFVGFVYLAPARATAIALSLERDRSGLERKTLVLPDGLRFVYLEGGTGEPLMLLHGFGGDKDNFTRVARFLTPHYRVIIPDLIGFAESAHPPDADYAPLAQAERLRRFATALGVSRPHLAGNSMGGQIAVTYAALHPDEVQSLWLLAPAGVWTAPASEVRTILEQTGRNPLMVRTKQEFRDLVPLVMADPPVLPGPMLDVMAKVRIANADLEERIFRLIATDSIERRADGLATPALIVWGDQDRALHVGSAEILHRLMPGSRVIIMPGIGHVPMVERPKQSAEDYLRFRGIP